MMLYSYAIHLRKGSYRSLPYARPSATNSPYAPVGTLPDEEEDIENFYLHSVRTPPVPGGPHVHTPSGSLSSFADFVAAPNRSRRNQKPLRGSGLNPANSAEPMDEVDEVLFDEDELAGAAHLKASTDESLSASGSGGRSSTEEDRVPLVGGAARRTNGRART